MTHVIGSRSDADIHLDVPSVAESHASLSVAKDGQVTLSDLESTQGTFLYLDNRWLRITSAPVTREDRVRLGDHETTVGALLDSTREKLNAAQSVRYQRDPETGKISEYRISPALEPIAPAGAAPRPSPGRAGSAPAVDPPPRRRLRYALLAIPALAAAAYGAYEIAGRSTAEVSSPDPAPMPCGDTQEANGEAQMPGCVDPNDNPGPEPVQDERAERHPVPDTSGGSTSPSENAALDPSGQATSTSEEGAESGDRPDRNDSATPDSAEQQQPDEGVRTAEAGQNATDDTRAPSDTETQPAHEEQAEDQPEQESNDESTGNAAETDGDATETDDVNAAEASADGDGAADAGDDPETRPSEGGSDTTGAEADGGPPQNTTDDEPQQEESDATGMGDTRTEPSEDDAPTENEADSETEIPDGPDTQPATDTEQPDSPDTGSEADETEDRPDDPATDEDSGGQEPHPDPEPEPAEEAEEEAGDNTAGEPEADTVTEQGARERLATLEEQMYRSAGENQDLLETYVENCTVCAFRDEAEATIARLEAVAPETECDRLAAAPDDGEKLESVPGVRWDVIDVAPALLACGLTQQQYPNDPRILFQLGRVYQKDERFEKAREYYSRSVEAAYGAGMAGMGDLYYSGSGVEKDYSKAAEWYRRGAEQNDPGAIKRLGSMYREGEGVSKDYAEAMRLFERAADLGNSDAMNAIGYMYMEGEGVAKDYAEAMRWYRRAVELHSPAGMHNIGYLHFAGHGVPKDYAEAMRWYRRAADLGLSASMTEIGRLYYNGHGVAKDYNETRRWYQRAIDASNHGHAYWEMAMLYSWGRGVQKNHRVSGEYAFKAVLYGYSHALEQAKRNRGYPAFKREIQRQLKQHGVYDGAIDGAIGPATRRALDAVFDTGE